MRDPGFHFRGCVLVLLLVTGCTRWEPFLVPTPEQSLPPYLRVSAPGRPSTLLMHPFVRRDTLYGRSRGDTLGIALTTIERLERPRLDEPRTVATIVGGLAAWLSVALLGFSGALD